MQRDQIPRYRPAATYVLPRWKLVYVSNPKAACTSIKWLLAELQGIEPTTFYKTLRFETTRATTIHRERTLWTGTPRLRRLSDEELADITPDNGWLVFTATRHPATRLWSAWQSKLLLREPAFVAQFGQQPWFPRIPRQTSDVLEDWFTFIDYVKADPELPILSDIHFRPQAKQLNIGSTPYDRIYDTSEFSLLLNDLTEHVKRLGFDGELKVRRSNETPLPALAAAFPPRVRAVIQDVYRRDYRALEYPRKVPPGVRTEKEYPQDLVATVGILVERHERLGDVTRQLRAERRARLAAEERTRRALRQLKRAAKKAPPPTLVKRIKRRLR